MSIEDARLHQVIFETPGRDDGRRNVLLSVSGDAPCRKPGPLQAPLARPRRRALWGQAQGGRGDHPAARSGDHIAKRQGVRQVKVPLRPRVSFWRLNS